MKKIVSILILSAILLLVYMYFSAEYYKNQDQILKNSQNSPINVAYRFDEANANLTGLSFDTIYPASSIKVRVTEEILDAGYVVCKNADFIHWDCTFDQPIPKNKLTVLQAVATP